MDEIYSYDWETDPETDMISRQAAIDTVEFGITYAKAINKSTGEVKELFKQGNKALNEAVERLKELPSVQPTLYGYPVEHLAMIARVLQKENLPPERIAEMLSDVGRIVGMVRDEFEEMLRNAASSSQNI